MKNKRIVLSVFIILFITIGVMIYIYTVDVNSVIKLAFYVDNTEESLVYCVSIKKNHTMVIEKGKNNYNYNVRIRKFIPVVDERVEIKLSEKEYNQIIEYADAIVQKENQLVDTMGGTHFIFYYKKQYLFGQPACEVTEVKKMLNYISEKSTLEFSVDGEDIIEMLINE